MLFHEVAETFNKIELISSRLEITNILSELLKKADADDARIIAYFSLGQLNPPYIGTNFNFAEKNALKTLSKLFDIDEDDLKNEFKEIGDLGKIVEKRQWKSEIELSIEDVYQKLIDIEKTTGIGSQELKQEKVLNLLKLTDSVSAKYIIKILTGSLRLGFSDMTLIDALSWMLKGNKSLRSEIENEYNICADIGLIAYNLKKGIKTSEIKIGIPIRPAAAERLNSAKDVIEKIGDCVAQPKLDGFRLQIHLDKTGKIPKVYFFSRNLVDMSNMFPDLVKEVIKIEADTLICEGEAVAYDVYSDNFMPFQETVKRKRKHGIDEIITELPLKIFFFDLLYLNGKSMLNLPHYERRNNLITTLKEVKDDVINIISEKKIDSAKELESYLLENIHAGLEGIVVKKPDSIYQAGKRNFNWIKLKRDIAGNLADTVDCVILGYYAGSGRRAEFGIGSILVGVYNKTKDSYQTIAKVGSGLSEVEWVELKAKCDAIKSKEQPKNVECDKNLFPDVWTFPEIVCTVKADEITLSPVHTSGKTEQNLGFALRFPRFISYRGDKKATESTSIKEIQEMYGLQYKK